MAVTAGALQINSGLSGSQSSPANTQANGQLASALPNYTYSPNGAGGVNYYKTFTSGALANQPVAINREAYASGTGSDPGSIESQALAAYKAGQQVAPPTTTTTSSSGSTVTPDQQALIQAQLDRLPNQQNIGSQNILDQYNNALAQLTNNNSLATRNYNTAVQQSQADHQTAIGNIDSGVRNQLSGLQRLLGSRGAGNSSAALTLAPYAAGREGSIQRGQVQTAYGRNMNALDTNYGDTENQFNDATANLGVQKQNNQNSLLSQIDQARQNLLAQQANPDINQINALGTQIDSLGRQVSFTPKAVDYKTPDLSKYDYSQPGLQANNNTSAADQYVTPYSYLLNGDQRKNLVGASVA